MSAFTTTLDHCTCCEHLLQVQHSMDESLRAHCLACSPLQGSQGSPCQDAAGACRTQRKAPVMRPSVQSHSHCWTEARDQDHKQE